MPFGDAVGMFANANLSVQFVTNYKMWLVWLVWMAFEASVSSVLSFIWKPLQNGVRMFPPLCHLQVACRHFEHRSPGRYLPV